MGEGWSSGLALNFCLWEMSCVCVCVCGGEGGS